MAATDRPPAARRNRPLVIVLIVLLVICLCCCAVWTFTRGPVIRLGCRVSDAFCGGFCRADPAECRRLGLPITP